MALKPCRECGKQVSSSADFCPYCGVRYPAADNPVLADTNSNNRGHHKGCLTPIGVIFFIVVGLAIVGSLVNNTNNPSSSKVLPCKYDWTKCSDNSDLVNHYTHWSDIQVACQIEAEKRAKYGTPKWPWLPFGSFYTGTSYITSGKAIAIEKDAQFQNGFGAMAHATVICFYDLNTNQVVDVSILQH
jgi:hypothetical protein